MTEGKVGKEAQNRFALNINQNFSKVEADVENIALKIRSRKTRDFNTKLKQQEASKY